MLLFRDSGVRALLSHTNLWGALMPVREEFRLGFQPVLQVPSGGLASGLPKLVSQTDDLVAGDSGRLLAPRFLVRCCAHVHNALTQIEPSGYPAER